MYSIPEPVIKLYPYGSRVYGTFNPLSDIDAIAVVESDEEFKYSVNKELGDVTVYSKPLFLKVLHEQHHISLLECIYLEDDEEWKDFELDLSKLRRAVSSVASNSFVKCKKKMRKNSKDFAPYIGKKSIFHSLRILMFGIQIAKHGRIIDYTEANYLYDEIMEMDSVKWGDYKERYQPLFNELKSEFRILAPLEKGVKNYA